MRTPVPARFPLAWSARVRFKRRGGRPMTVLNLDAGPRLAPGGIQMIGQLSAHDVSASYASFGIVRVSVAQRTTQPLAATAQPAGDRVTLSPDAQAAGEVGAPSETAPPTTSASEPADSRSVAPPSRAGRLAAALMSALDADQNGAVSKEEFVTGASALLRGARRTERDDHDDAHREVERSHGKHGHGGHRLERRLGRAFNRIDADDDGQLTDTELVAVLARLRPRPAEASSPETGGTETSAVPVSPEPTAPPAVPPQESAAGTAAAPGGAPAHTESSTAPAIAPAQAGQTVPDPTSARGTLFSFSVTTVTYVSVAVQQYRAVDALRG